MAAPKKPNGGRPKLEITPVIWKEICDRVAAGESIRKVLNSNKDKYPQWDRFRAEKDKNEQFNAQYVKAIQDKGEMEVCDIEEICEELKKGKIDASSANVIIQAKKWKAAKFYPKMYGEKLDLTTKDEKIGSDAIDYSKLSDSVLKAIIEAKKPDDSD
jgi:hypothetical protein